MDAIACARRPHSEGNRRVAWSDSSTGSTCLPGPPSFPFRHAESVHPGARVENAGAGYLRLSAQDI